jgi:hypothetical protein
MAFGPDLLDIFKRAAAYVDRIPRATNIYDLNVNGSAGTIDGLLPILEYARSKQTS